MKSLRKVAIVMAIYFPMLTGIMSCSSEEGVGFKTVYDYEENIGMSEEVARQLADGEYHGAFMLDTVLFYGTDLEGNIKKSTIIEGFSIAKYTYVGIDGDKVFWTPDYSIAEQSILSLAYEGLFDSKSQTGHYEHDFLVESDFKFDIMDNYVTSRYGKKDYIFQIRGDLLVISLYKPNDGYICEHRFKRVEALDYERVLRFKDDIEVWEYASQKIIEKYGEEWYTRRWNHLNHITWDPFM